METQEIENIDMTAAKEYLNTATVKAVQVGVYDWVIERPSGQRDTVSNDMFQKYWRRV